jgi:hypothetical protein
LDRIVQGRSATLSVTFTVDGVATDPDPETATVQIVRDDGTELVPAGTGTSHVEDGEFTYTLTPAQTAQLDILTARWTATFGGQAQVLTTIVEIAGGVLFTLAEARALTPLDNVELYPTAELLAARVVAEQVLEDACNYAFVSRYHREQPVVDALGRLLLAKREVRSIRSLSIDGAALTEDDIAALALSGGIVTGNPLTGTRYEIAYEHGVTTPPALASRIALRLAKRYLVKTPIDERASTMTTDDGTITLVTPGLRGMLFDIPEANAFVQRYSRPATRLA